VSQTAE